MTVQGGSTGGVIINPNWGSMYAMGKKGSWADGATLAEKMEDPGTFGFVFDTREGSQGIYLSAGTTKLVVDEDNMLTVDKIKTDTLSVGDITDVETAITDNVKAIETEVTAREAADTALQTNINKEQADRIEMVKAEEALRAEADENLQTNINAEAVARDTADQNLQANINKEQADRIEMVKAEEALRAEADENLQTNINAEAVARDTADQNLQENINAEAATREAADTTLQANIDAEAKDRKAKENMINQALVAHQKQIEKNMTNIAANTKAISAEETARKAADETLQTNIDNEAKAREAADTNIINNYQAADSQLSSKIDSVDSNSKKGIAGVAALAALHPLDFDPDAKWDFAAGYGNYRGENAAAIGAYYRPNEDIMFSVGGTVGNSDNNSVNAGLSIKIGAGSSHVNNSKTAMAKEIKNLQESMSKLEAQNMQLAAMVNALLGANEQLPAVNMFPDVPENHWAYEAVKSMVNSGLVEGYPDGEFKGDRSLTRYEFAQIIANARQKGAEIDARLLQEFYPELQYFHIDAVHHDKNGNATVERVRVNN